MHDRMDAHAPAPPLVSILILSASALAYEVLLVRLLSIIHWHHFAFMVISIALLGYGASGSLITVFRERLLANYDSVFIINSTLFGLSAIACFITVQHLPFNALEILWDDSQWLRLMSSYLLLTLPFFFVANAIALTLMRFHQHIPLIYGVDLIGAGAGAVLIMLTLLVLPPDTVLRLLGMTGIAAGLFALKHRHTSERYRTAGMLAICMLAVILTPQAWLDLRMSEYKGLSATLLIKGAQKQLQHSSSMSMIDVVESPVVPFRNAPGMSLNSPAKPPEQLAVFRDGDEMTTIDRFEVDTSLAYHDYMSSALPYHLQQRPRHVLVLGSATGAGLLQAYYHDAQAIDAVEPDAELSQLISSDYADYFGWPQLQQRVSLERMTPRSFTARRQAAEDGVRYDLIVMGPAGGSAGGAAGVHALAASYDHTVEAITSYLSLLKPDGMLSITSWTANPPRGSLRLFVTAVEAMRGSGIDNPGDHIAWIRSWNTATLVLKSSPLTTSEIAKVRDFSRSRSFDLAWLPGMTAGEANRYQLLQDPVFKLAADSVLNDSGQQFIRDYKYDILPVHDNSPYFDNYFRWSSLDELIALPGGAGISLVGVGYPTLLLTLAQAVLAAFLLILLPLAFVREDRERPSRRRRNIIVYFLSIGLAFLFIEIAFIQKFSLIIGQPLYAVAVVLCAFLVFSGLGSLYVQKRTGEGTSDSDMLKLSITTIMVTTLVYVIVLPALVTPIMSLSEALRFILAFLMTAPIAFAMGMPFPIGLEATQRSSRHLIPWAWAINGCASVLSAILAVMLAMEVGFSGVMLCAAALYVLAWIYRV